MKHEVSIRLAGQIMLKAWWAQTRMDRYVVWFGLGSAIRLKARHIKGLIGDILDVQYQSFFASIAIRLILTDPLMHSQSEYY